MLNIPTPKVNGVDTLDGTNHTSLLEEAKNLATGGGEAIGGDTFQWSRTVAAYASAGNDYSVSGTDNYILAPRASFKTPLAYTEGEVVSFIVPNANTGAVTLNANARGPITAKKNNGADDLVAGDLVAGDDVSFKYRAAGPHFEWLSSAKKLIKPKKNAFRAYLSSNQSINNLTVTKVQLDAENFDTNNSYDNTTNFRHTPQTPGRYQYLCGNRWSGAADLFSVFLYKNGAVYSLSTPASQGFTSSPGLSFSDIIQMNGTTDFVEFFVQQTTGVAVDVLAGTQSTFLAGFLIEND